SGLWSIYIAQYDAEGNFKWAKIAASGSSIDVNSICLDKSGNMAIVGEFSGSAVFGNNSVTLTSSADYDVFVARFNSEGELSWGKSVAGQGFDYASGVSSDDAGNFYFTGEFHKSSFNGSASKIFLAKYDSSGNFVWMKMPQDYSNFHGGNAIKTMADGTSYITGIFFDSLSFDSSIVLDAGNVESNIFIGKFDADGNILWLQKAGAGSGYTGAEAIDADQSGNAYVTGFYRGTISFGSLTLTGPTDLTYDVFIAKCDADGNFLWVNKAYGAGVLDDGTAICVDNSGDCYVAGYFSADFTLGNTVLSNSGDEDVFIAKIDALGNFIWATQCGGMNAVNVGGMKVNASGIFVDGNFTNDISFGNTITLTADVPDQSDIFISKIDNTTGIPGEGDSSSSFFLFPNPVADEFQLKGASDFFEYTIYDAQGRFMSEGSGSEGEKISVQNLPAGIYFIDIRKKGSAQFRKIKFIKN
ncbi:MAG: T9SS type A sorting domain-containing protein, partial [Chitinophagales bacterium]